MNPIIKKLLPGLLPLLIFVLADEIFGTTIGLFVAIGFGIVQLIFSRLKNKTWDKFVIFDTLLLVILGLISIILENETLFLWKPVFIELILAIFIAISIFSKHNLLFMMSKRYMGDISINDEQIKVFNRNFLILFVLTILHIALTIYSIYFMSKEAWVFISTILFYIIIGIYFMIMLIFNYIKRKCVSKEMVPIINDEGKIIGKSPRSEVHNGSHLLHPVVHLHVLKEDGCILLQKRPKNKQIQPGKWDTAVGGHVNFGESIDNALFRETKEEIGLSNFKPQFFKQYRWNSEIESEQIFVFICIVDNNQRFKTTDEVADLRFWSRKEINDMIGKNIFTPNFESEFLMLQ